MGGKSPCLDHGRVNCANKSKELGTPHGKGGGGWSIRGLNETASILSGQQMLEITVPLEQFQLASAPEEKRRKEILLEKNMVYKK